MSGGHMFNIVSVQKSEFAPAVARQAFVTGGVPFASWSVGASLKIWRESRTHPWGFSVGLVERRRIYLAALSLWPRRPPPPPLFLNLDSDCPKSPTGRPCPTRRPTGDLPLAMQ